MDKEQYEQMKTCHVLLAVMRKKDNEGVESKKIFRQIVRDFHKDLEIISKKCELEGGIWRVYHSVNSRDMVKALKLFRHTIIDTEKTSIESLWRKELLQPHNRATKNFMVDVDDPAEFEAIYTSLMKLGCEDLGTHKSLNGIHQIVTKFDRHTFAQQHPNVDVLTDGYYFIQMVKADNLTKR